MSIRPVDAIRTRSGQKRAFVRGHPTSDVPSPYHADVSTLVGGRCQQPISGTVTSLHCVNRAPRSVPSHGAPARQKAPRWSCLGDATTAGEGGRLALRRKRAPDGARLVGGAHATSLAEVLRPSCRRIWVALLWLFGGVSVEKRLQKPWAAAVPTGGVCDQPSSALTELPDGCPFRRETVGGWGPTGLLSVRHFWALWGVCWGPFLR